MLRTFKTDYHEKIQKLEDELNIRLCLADNDFMEEETLIQDDECTVSSCSSQTSSGDIEKGPYVSTILVKGPNKVSGSRIDNSTNSLSQEVNSEELVTTM